VKGIELLRRVLVRVPGSVSGEASNAWRAGVVDPSNAHSSEQYRASKYDVRLRNLICELTFMIMPIWLNELVAHGRDNHRLYKLFQYLETVFPVLFPPELYGIDWRDEDVRRLLWEYQLAKT
jgi:hypothetical protein